MTSTSPLLSQIFVALALVSAAGVVGIMVYGLAGMSKEGTEAAEKRQNAMRLRILLQGIAVGFLFLAWVLG